MVYNKDLVLKFFTMIFIVGLLSCCKAPSNTPLLSMTATAIQLPVNTSILPITPSFSQMPTNTITIAGKFNTPTSITPTIVIQTLSSEEKEKVIALLLTEDYPCTLPCFGGIKPGVTTWLDAKNFLQQFADIYGDSAEMNYEGEKPVLGFYIQDNVVEAMGVPRFEYPLYRLLQDYGKPDEIYFYVLDVLPIDNNNPYTVYLFYKEKGIVAEYNGVSAKGTTISVCFKDNHGQKSRTAFLSLWSQGSDKNFEDVIAQYMSKFSLGYLSMKYYKLENLSTYTTSDFFEIYQLEENENHCLKIQNPNPKPS